MEATKVAAAAFALLSGCAAEQPRDFCAVSSPITIGAKEKLSKETLKQISEHNGRGERLCGWRNK